MTVSIMSSVVSRVLLVSSLWCAIGLATGCDRHDDATAAASAAKSGTPTTFAPRSHQLVEKGVTPLRTRNVTPALPADDPAAERISVSTNADPDEGGAPLTVNFTAEAEGPPGLRYRWNFGDHSPPALQLNVQHTYRSPGEYTAVLTVTGPDGEETDEVSINVSEEGFDVSIDADPDIGKPPLTVHFSAVLDDDLPGPFYYQWDFGDGGRDVANPTTHTYRVAGEYTATVVVTNSQGQSGRQEVDIQVDADDAAQ